MVTSRVGRSRPLSGHQQAITVVFLVAFVAYVLWADIRWASLDVWALVVFYGAVAVVTFGTMVAGTQWRRFAHLPPATGRIIAIVPVYNEARPYLMETILALASQTIPPDEIHVIDDGSVDPVVAFDHPLVHWHRQENEGKRHAQAKVLRESPRAEWDFVLTVDSDSVPDADAVEHLLRSMSNPKVQAATGMILMRNWRDNLLTRLVDINVITTCLTFRMIRSWLGIVSPTSGALALYRAAVVYDNLDDYVSSGTVGDDRRLSFYALLRGEVVGVSEAVVETHLPSTFSGTFQQRLRWSKSAWLGIPFVSTNLRPLAVLFYVFPLAFTLMWPFVVLMLGRVSYLYDKPALLYGLLYWEVVAIVMTGICSVYRPDFTLTQKLQMWALAPLYPIFGAVLLRPAAFWALTQLRSQAWHTRESVPPAAPLAAPVLALVPRQRAPSDLEVPGVAMEAEPVGMAQSRVTGRRWFR